MFYLLKLQVTLLLTCLVNTVQKGTCYDLQPLPHNKILARQFVQCVPTLDILGIEFILFRGIELSI